MKRFLIILLLVAGAAGLGLLYANLTFLPSPPDRELALTPRAQHFVVAAVEPPAEEPELAEPAVNDNPFSPERGMTPAEAAPENPVSELPRFELVGILMIGDRAGAVIENLSSGGGVSGRKRRFFPVGAEVGSGFAVEAIGERSVILRRNGEVVELKIGRQRSSLKGKGVMELRRSAAIVPEEARLPIVPEEVRPPMIRKTETGAIEITDETVELHGE